MEFSQQVSREYNPHQLWNSTSGAMMPELYPTHGFVTTPHPHFTSPPATPMTPMTPAPLQQFNMHPYHELPPGSITYHPNHQLPPPPPPPPPPCPSTPEFRLFSLCQHLQKYPSVAKENRGAFWKDFMEEYFVEKATLVIETELGGQTEKFRLKGEWVCQYFQSMMDNGVTSMHFDLVGVDSNYQMALQQLECMTATMETHHATPQPTKVCAMGHLNMEFSLDQNPRIMVWYFNIKDHVEYVPRSTSNQQSEQGMVEGITTKGLLGTTLTVLREGERAEENYHRTAEATTFHTPAGTPMGNSASTNGLHHPSPWQDNIHLLPMPPVLDLMHPEVSGAGLSVGGLMQTVSPVGPLQHMMPSSSPSPCVPHPCSNGSGTSGGKGGGSKSKANRSNNGGGSRKRHSPTSEISSSAKRGCLLVAEEPVHIPDPDDLVFAMDERIIERIDKNSQTNFNGKVEPHTPTNSTTPTSSMSSPLPMTTGSSSLLNGPTTTSITSETIINGSTLTTPPTPTLPGTSKLCHLQEHPHHQTISSSSPVPSSSSAGVQGFLHSATISSNMQGVELDQPAHMMGGAIMNQHAPHMYDSPVPQWADKLVLVNQGALAITR